MSMFDQNYIFVKSPLMDIIWLLMDYFMLFEYEFNKKKRWV